MRARLDYSNPQGQHISLALIKLPATDPAHRIGTLFVNPGGPASRASTSSPGSARSCTGRR
jgi:hypothetical protein